VHLLRPYNVVIAANMVTSARAPQRACPLVPESPLLRIQDILDAIAKIRRYTLDMTLESFSADEKTVDVASGRTKPIADCSTPHDRVE